MRTQYPTLKQVVDANHEQLCRWWRFLNSPGMSAIDDPMSTQEQIDTAIASECTIMNLIGSRLFGEFGGFTAEISKKIGWDRGGTKDGRPL